MVSSRRKIDYKTRLTDLLVVICIVLGAAAVTIFGHLNFLSATLLFFGLPSLYLIWRKPSNFKKAGLAATLLGLIWGFAFDYIAEFNHAWGWSTNTALTLPVSFFGIVSLDILIWYFLWIFLIIAFYEYFAEYDFSKRISRNAPWAAGIGLVVIFVVVVLSKTVPHALAFQYPYLILGSITLIPFGYIVIRRPKILPKILEIVPFFIFVYLTFELTALYTHLWGFPGHYIGSVSILNQTFPFEELFFWIIASSAVAACYHEYCIDDQK